MQLSSKIQFTLIFSCLLSCYRTLAQKSSTALKSNAVASTSSTTPQTAFRTDLISPSPNAASLGKFGLIPVSLYTGVPNISISLGAASGRQISVPISLSYHHSGLKSWEKASWVGLGWSLNCGGVITRIIKDKVDELTPKQYKYDQNISKYSVSVSVDQDFLDGAMYYGTYDTEPDIYTFNFGQYCGTFLFYQDKIYQFPYQKLKITGTASGPFTITTEDGSIYTFAATELTQPKQSDGASYTVPQHTSSWFLSSIQPADKTETINFYYSDAEPILMHGPSSQTYLKVTSGDINSILNPIQASPASTVYSIRLTQIATSKMTVDFVPQTTTRTDIDGTSYALDQVEFRNKDGYLIKAFKFNYNYFNPGNKLASPLKLTSLDALDHNLAFPQTHTFQYNESSVFPILTNAVDHWGYINNVGDPTVLIPNTILSNGANREPNEAYSSLGMLSSITYPTGGQSIFEYEPNTYFTSQEYQKKAISANATVSRPAGKESDNTLLSQMVQFTIPFKQDVTISYSRTPKIPVKDDDPNNGPDAPTKDVEPEITLTTEVITGHEPVYKINYNRDNGGQTATVTLEPNTYYMTVQCDSEELSVYGAVGYVEQTNIPVEAPKGPGLRIKRISDYTGTANAKTLAYSKTYRYIDSLGFSTGILQKAVNYGGTDTYTTRDYSAVDPGSVEKTYLTYQSAINSALGDLLDQEMYYNEVYEDQASAAGTLRKRHRFTSYDNAYDYQHSGVYPTEETDYQISDNKFLPISKRLFKYNSISDSILSALKPYQTVQILGTTGDRRRVYDTHWYSLFPFTWVYKTSETNYLYSGPTAVPVKTTFHNDISNHNLSSMNLSLSNGWEKVTKLKYPENYGSGTMQKMASNNILSPIIEKEEWIKRSGTDSSMIAGTITEFDDVLFKPKAGYRLESATPTKSLDQEAQDANGKYTSLLSDSRYTKRINYTYDSSTGNLTSQDMTGSANAKQFVYLWGYNSQYPIAEIRNASYADVIAVLTQDVIDKLAGSSPGDDASVRSTLNQLRTSSKLKGAQMTTYTYSPLVGMTSQTDAGGHTTYYEYDGFQRLVNIKDQNGKILKHYDYHYQGQ